MIGPGQIRKAEDKASGTLAAQDTTSRKSKGRGMGDDLVVGRHESLKRGGRAFHVRE